MGFFDWFIDDVLGIDLPDTNAIQQQTQQQISGATSALNEANAIARESAAKSLKAQEDANKIAAAASRPAVDSESARVAEDELRRKRATGSSFGVGLPAKFGEPPVGFRVLSGQ